MTTASIIRQLDDLGVSIQSRGEYRRPFGYGLLISASVRPHRSSGHEADSNQTPLTPISLTRARALRGDQSDH